MNEKWTLPKEEEIEPFWTSRIERTLVGRTIVGVQYLTVEEQKEMGWFKRPIVLILDDGNYLMPMQDDEGNDGGALATGYKNLQTIPIIN